MASIALRRRGPPAVLLIAAVLPAGCGQHAAPTKEASFQLEQAWVEAAPLGGTASVYITLRNQGAIALPFVVAVMSDAEEVRFVCDSVHPLHLGLNGFQLGAGETVEMRQAGIHYELVGLRRALVSGGQAGLTLILLNGMRFRLVLEIRDTPPPASVPSPAIPIIDHSSPWATT